MTSPCELDLAGAARALTELTAGRERVILGLTGPPAAGKSTAAAALARTSELPAVVVPMDGFHLSQAVLDARDLAAVKGAPHTFDAAGYVELVARLRRDLHRTVWAPAFDRTLEDPVAGSIEIPPGTRVVITEGNYLLLAEPPWSQLPELLDAIWYVETPDPLRRDRLIARHHEFGRPLHEATARALGTDERNAELIRATRARADAVLTLE